MTIQQKIESKTKEFEAVHAEQERLWAVVELKQAELNECQKLWNDAYTKAGSLRLEIAALKTIAEEMESA